MKLANRLLKELPCVDCAGDVNWKVLRDVELFVATVEKEIRARRGHTLRILRDDDEGHAYWVNRLERQRRAGKDFFADLLSAKAGRSVIQPFHETPFFAVLSEYRAPAGTSLLVEMLFSAILVFTLLAFVPPPLRTASPQVAF